MAKEKAQTLFDFREELPGLYDPGEKPALIDIPPMRFIAIEGYGGLYEENSAFMDAIDQLYQMTDILRSLPDRGIDVHGFYDYAYPPVEALWMESDKMPWESAPRRTSAWAVMIRVPDFITGELFELSCEEAAKTEKGIDCERIYILEYADGPCIQLTQDQSYIADEKCQALMDELIEKEMIEFDLCPGRFRHFVFLADPRYTKPENRITIVRYPVFMAEL